VVKTPENRAATWRPVSPVVKGADAEQQRRREGEDPSRHLRLRSGSERHQSYPGRDCDREGRRVEPSSKFGLDRGDGVSELVVRGHEKRLADRPLGSSPLPERLSVSGLPRAE
jgi:hypothetical protein